MGEPNTSLRAVRQSMRMSQDELARAIRQAGQRAGEPNGCSKRIIQRWEAGAVATPRGAYLRALEYVTGQPIENLGFKPADESYGMDRDKRWRRARRVDSPRGPEGKGPLTGIWLGLRVPELQPGRTFASEHYVVVIQHGARFRCVGARLQIEGDDGPDRQRPWSPAHGASRPTPKGTTRGASTTGPCNSCLTRPGTG